MRSITIWLLGRMFSGSRLPFVPHTPTQAVPQGQRFTVFFFQQRKRARSHSADTHHQGANWNSLFVFFHLKEEQTNTMWRLKQVQEEDSDTNLDVRVVFAGGAPLPSTALLLPVLVKLRVSEDGHSPALVDQRQGRHAVQTLFICRWNGQHYGHRKVDHTT